jgi:peptidyl-prolyl cis-trans isomerase A (cyclophilin A)
VEVTDRHLMLVTAIVVLDAAADTAATLSPMANTLISAPPPSSGGGGGGGSTGLAFVLALGVLNVLRRTRRLRARD